MAKRVFHNDEPKDVDSLKRDQFATAFAKIAETCETPMVIGLYGTWGIGKTTLMKLIDKKLDKRTTRPVWFDAWQHQFDENPALALLHTIVDQFDMQQKEELKKLLIVIAGAFGSMLLKATTNLKMKDINKLGERYEEERFLTAEKRVRLHNHIKEIVNKAQGTPKRRLVFFIDDLDRCMPSSLLSLLESLKLYLNLPGCVYFLGADRLALECSIKFHYKDVDISEANYLDKIVQLPFDIPPITPESIEMFIKQFLSNDLEPCLPLLVKGLGDNPRQVKRFINTLTLNHQLALGVNIPNYASSILAILLLIQLRSPGLYNLIANRNDLLLKLKKGQEEVKSIQEEYLEKDNQLKDAINEVAIPEDTPFKMYIYLTQLVKVSEEPIFDEKKTHLRSILIEHKKWIKTKGKEGSKANLKKADLSFADLSEADLREADLYGANLSRADLSDADLRAANLRFADLREANLSRANLRTAYLREADFSWADLWGADLSRAYLRGAHLLNTNLKGTNLKGTNLREADLSVVEDLTIEQLSKVKTLYEAKLDSELTEQINKMYPHLLEAPKLEEK